MGCCGKTKNLITTGKQIVEGYRNLATGKKYEFTDGRIRICRSCDKNFWINNKHLFCSVCKCYIPAKARVIEAECPLDLWPDKKGILKNG